MFVVRWKQLLIKNTMKNFDSKNRLVSRLSILTLVFLPLLVMSACRQEESALLTCLPESRQLTDIVSVEGVATTSEEANKLKKVTISEKLKELQASCKNNRLVDTQSKEIVFFDLQFCGGAPPPEGAVEKQREEVIALQKKYTVITMTCNPVGLPYP